MDIKNCISVVSYEDMIDHRSYAYNLSSCEIKDGKNSGLTVFEPMTSGILHHGFFIQTKLSVNCLLYIKINAVALTSRFCKPTFIGCFITVAGFSD